MPKAVPLSARLFRRIDRSGSCHLWTGPLNHDGYGKITDDNGRKVFVHRAAYEFQRGPVPPGLTVDHLCQVRHCCNIAHMEAVTLRENIRRSDGPAGRAARRTHCPAGHPYAGANLITERGGARKCRECDRARRVAKYARVKEAQKCPRN